MAGPRLLRWFLMTDFIFGLDISLRTCFMGSKTPHHLQTFELSNTSSVFNDTDGGVHGVTIDPCIYRNSSVLQVNWRNIPDENTSKTLCVTVYYLSVNRTNCFKISALKRKKRKITCWLHVEWLEGLAVINAFVRNQSGSVIQYGNILFFTNSCRDPCDDNVPDLDIRVLTCGVTKELKISSNTKIITVRLISQYKRTMLLEITKTKIKTRIHLHIDKNTSPGYYTLEILANINSKLHDDACKFQVKEVYVHCDTTTQTPLSAQTVLTTPKSGLSVQIQLGSSILGSLVALLVVTIIFCIVYRKYRQRDQGHEQISPLRHQSRNELNNQDLLMSTTSL